MISIPLSILDLSTSPKSRVSSLSAKLERVYPNLLESLMSTRLSTYRSTQLI
jgi:hypothetical protein